MKSVISWLFIVGFLTTVLITQTESLRYLIAILFTLVILRNNYVLKGIYSLESKYYYSYLGIISFLTILVLIISFIYQERNVEKIFLILGGISLIFDKKSQ